MGIADRDFASGIPSPLAAGALAEKPEDFHLPVFLRRERDLILNSNPLQTPLLRTIVGHFFTDDLMCSYSNLGYFWDIFTFAESINQRMDLKL